MNYTEVYTNTFANIQYSNHYHVQYDNVLERLANIYNKDSYFSVIDVGSGRGQLIKNIKDNYPNSEITSVDLNQFHNENIVEFIKCDLSVETDRQKLLEKSYDVVTCTDVLEHLDESFIEEVIQMLSKLAKHSILAIANHSDIWNGIELHTIQKDCDWWTRLIEKYYVIRASQVLYNNRLYEFDCDVLNQ